MTVDPNVAPQAARPPHVEGENSEAPSERFQRAVERLVDACYSLGVLRGSDDMTRNIESAEISCEAERDAASKALLAEWEAQYDDAALWQRHAYAAREQVSKLYAELAALKASQSTPTTGREQGEVESDEDQIARALAKATDAQRKPGRTFRSAPYTRVLVTKAGSGDSEAGSTAMQRDKSPSSRAPDADKSAPAIAATVPLSLIAEAKALCDNATPGPWTVDPWGKHGCVIWSEISAIARVAEWLNNPGDLEFILRARSLMPKLIAALESPAPASVEGKVVDHHDLMPNWHVRIVVLPDGWPIGAKVRITRLDPEANDDSAQ